MDDLKTEINRYLFVEFGLDGDEALVSPEWPFELTPLLEAEGLTVFEFNTDEPYFAVVDESLDFVPQAGMTIQDLVLQRSGTAWIGERDPVDLAEVRLGDPDVPGTAERRRRLEALGTGAFLGVEAEILTGLFLRSEQIDLGLFRGPGSDEVVVAGLPDASLVPVRFPKASASRRLAWGVGSWLSSKNPTG